MKAAIRKKYCSPEEIKVVEIEKPKIKDNQVLVKVYATTVNRTDCANLTAKPFIMRFILGLFKPNKKVLGTDFAGAIVAVGKKVNSFKEGDKVFGFIDAGASSQATFAAIETKHLFLIPEGINYNLAAASIEGAHYAYTFIRKSNIQANQNILINGATGGIGTALLQFVKQFDVEVTATANTKNIDLIKSLGADMVIDYTKEDFTTRTVEYDYIFDAVGKSTFSKCKGLLKPKGTYISSELGPHSQNIFYALFTPIFGKKKVIFPIPYSKLMSIPYISELLINGTFKPVIEKEVELDHIAAAYAYVIQGLKTGNVVVTID